MFESDNYVAHILAVFDWPRYRDLWLEALQKYPENYWATYAEESQLAPIVWFDRCTAIENQQCAFGLCHNTKLVGIVRVILGQGDPRYEGEAVLSGLYKQEDPSHNHGGAVGMLLSVATDWAARQQKFKKLFAAARIENCAAQNALIAAGYKTGPDADDVQDIDEWPATGLPARQRWYNHDLLAVRARLEKNAPVGMD